MITSNTKIISIFGNPIKHSLSPIMQNKWLVKYKVDAIYCSACIDKKYLQQAIQSIKVLDMLGANITVPYKVDVIKYLDKIDLSSKQIGSVNTIVNKNNKLYGYNTDWIGFLDDLKSKKINLKNKRIFVLGAGGACKAILYALNKAKVKNIFLASRTYQKVIKLSKLYNNIIPIKIENVKNDLLKDIDVFINTSTCGMQKQDKLPFNIVKCNKNIIFYDLIYNKNTPFKQFANKNKLQYFSGEGMLIRQGAFSFKLWTSQYPNIDIVKNLFRGK